MDPSEPSDVDVVRAVLAGHTDAYGVLVRRYQDVLYAHAVRVVGGGDEAADLVQRALITGFERLRTLTEPHRVGGWLFRITSNLCRDHLRSRKRTVPLRVAAPVADAREGPDGVAHGNELRGRVDDALERLPPEQREAFVMKHVEGRSYGEMADLLDISVPALKMRVHRARDGLREVLEAYR